MGDKSKISWTDATWNPVTGCTKISEGCRNCYAERMSKRLVAIGQKNYANGFDHVTCHPHMLDQPIRWKRHRRIFVCSMSDLFHEDVPDGFINQVMGVMSRATHHTFLVLTKRPERMHRHFSTWGEDPMPNVWVGVTVEDQKAADERIPILVDLDAAVKWLSCEPLIGHVDIARWVHKLDWVVVGGESGPCARVMCSGWVHYLYRLCKLTGVPFHFKQWGEYNSMGIRVGKRNAGRIFMGQTCDEFPGGTNG